MASASDFMDSLKELPNELHRNFSLMLDLDSRSQKLMTNIDKMTGSYMLNVKKHSVEEKKKTMARIQQKFDAAKELSDDKVQLSIQTYELVDQRIRRLDSEIARFKSKIQLKAGIRESAFNAKKKLQLKKGTQLTSATSLVGAVSDLTSPAYSVANVPVETSSFTGSVVDAGVIHAADADMPIDPNEPTFCLCNQVSFGEMIGCDDPDCAIEWFHFGCVNLITKPKGKWFCPKCTKDKKKNKKILK
ncbi:PREDICTED: inhibitor of growth protein 4-like [Diuraphis noxia]|uniref:inhibitor of growth protein 4-like n=1 Tax=Diuraphis noxia TaxID=143948 RepID=UPI0007637067|nr:PREDICTED: inhibitor of growth protein 4-like [Diuraphis noxia]XP_015371040.1 PREDICTED: inhibitor of growth protein 4-like [Diuraphis noxia]